jgi:hypothetical protein
LESPAATPASTSRSRRVSFCTRLRARLAQSQAADLRGIGIDFGKRRGNRIGLSPEPPGLFASSSCNSGRQLQPTTSLFPGASSIIT